MTTRFRFFWLTLFPFLFLSACSGEIRGIVFLDANSNGIADPSEMSLTNVNIKVSRDSEVIGRTKSNLNGVFSVRNDDPGYYCIEVEEPSLQENLMARLSGGQLPKGSTPTVNSNIGVGPPVKSVVAGKQILGDGGGGGQDSPNPARKKENEDEEEEDKDKTGEKDEEPVSPPPPPTPNRVSSGIVCKNITGTNLTADVGVALDYDADIERIPPPLKRIYTLGEVFTLSIPYPLGCMLRPLFIPDGLEVFWPSAQNKQDPAILRIDPKSGRVDFREGVLTGSVTLHLRVREDLPWGRHEIEIVPAALCPDGTSKELAAVPLELKAIPNVVIHQQIHERGVGGGEAHWEVVVENKSEKDLTVTVTATPPIDYVDLKPIQGLRCHRIGGNIECPNLTLKAKSDTRANPLRFALEYEEVDRETDVSFQAMVVVEDFGEESFHANDASVTIFP